MNPKERVHEALAERQYFKLICGASFFDAEKVNALVQVYAHAEADCIDIACEPPILNAVQDALNSLPQEVKPPMIMVSLDVDGDPHFRKVQVRRTACVDCEACLPACPVEALRMDESHRFQIIEARCYGCSRCIPLCPTEALSFKPVSQLPEVLHEVLSHALVEAVELHTHQLESASLERLFEAIGDTFTNKWISLCFRPLEHDKLTVHAYLTHFDALCQQVKPYGVMLQIDGIPMQSDESHDSSQSALAGVHALPDEWKNRFPITISGGINRHTATLIKENETFQGVRGVGMGTLARKLVWHCLEEPKAFEKGVVLARELVSSFRR